MQDTSLPGAQRSVAVRVLNWRHTLRALPLRADAAPQPSPYNPTDGDSRERLFVKCRFASCNCAKPLQPLLTHVPMTQTAGRFSSDCLCLGCREIVCEGDGIKSFRFSHPEPAGMADVLPVVYQPGQYASFDFQVRTSPIPCAEATHCATP